MCLAVPGRVTSIEGYEARVDLSGIERVVNVMLVPDLDVGQFVLIHAGFAIQVLDAGEAAEILEIFDEARVTLEGDGA